MFFLFSCNSERKEFEKVKKQNTEEAYTEFIKNFPESSFVNEAKDLRLKTDSIEVIISTFLGNERRNYYGDSLPDRLDTIWKFYLGEGLSPAYGYDKIWKGAGWTGQPSLIKEKGRYYIIQSAFDYGVHKIDVLTAEEIWIYKFDDILKGSPTIWVNKHADNIEDRYVILQGSRRGWDKDLTSEFCWSFRAVSYISGKELWRHNSIATDSYSRDVDASALVISDTGYIPLENAIFTIFDPDHTKGSKFNGYTIPKIYRELQYYTQADVDAHGDAIEAESSPTLIGDRIYTASGTGWIYGYNITKGKNDWEFYIGSDLNGSMPATHDNCLLVPIEKEHISGNGGVMKIDPSKNPEDAVVWFFPTDSVKWLHWEGGIIGSITINDKTKKPDEPYLATFIDCNGDLFVLDYMSFEPDSTVWCPNLKQKHSTPKLLAKIRTHPSIATPIIVQNRILAPTDSGLFLFEFKFVNDEFQIELIDKNLNKSFDATAIAWNGRIYLADFEGYLWCYGLR